MMQVTKATNNRHFNGELLYIISLNNPLDMLQCMKIIQDVYMDYTLVITIFCIFDHVVIHK